MLKKLLLITVVGLIIFGINRISFAMDCCDNKEVKEWKGIQKAQPKTKDHAKSGCPYLASKKNLKNISKK